MPRTCMWEWDYNSAILDQGTRLGLMSNAAAVLLRWVQPPAAVVPAQELAWELLKTEQFLTLPEIDHRFVGRPAVA
jgi:hypothetical protein